MGYSGSEGYVTQVGELFLQWVPHVNSAFLNHDIRVPGFDAVHIPCRAFVSE